MKKLYRHNTISIILAFLVGAFCIFGFLASISTGHEITALIYGVNVLFLSRLSYKGLVMNKRIKAFNEIKRQFDEGEINRLEAMGKLDELKEEIKNG